QGWSPATSTNYSFRDPSLPNKIWVSASGIDKGEFEPKDFLAVNLEGKPYGVNEKRKPSAETLLHTFLYDSLKNINAVVHTHSIAATVLSKLFPKEINLEQYELQKAFTGLLTHEQSHKIPVFENKQDMNELVSEIRAWLQEGNHFSIPVFVIKQHGTYVWGDSIRAAKRHLEAIEFLFECELKFLSSKA
ncbi:MAG: methylthioribulose 1-phosphate dehydratase, partial [Luteibaculum sp.]